VTDAGRLATDVCGLSFRNPIVLAAGTAGYGRELGGVLDLDAVGGFVTKAVSRAPRAGAPAPRVADFDGGMINAVGLANPGLDAVRADHVPWLAGHHRATRRFANVVGFTIEEYGEVTAGLEAALVDHPGALDAYELNVSCPNTKAGGMEFGADPESLRAVVSLARAATRRPLFVKLSPMVDVATAARVAADAGADGITVVNTIPGLVIDVEARRPVLGFGSGGVSGAAVLPVGVLAAWKVRRAVSLPIMGVGGAASATDVLQYLMAGASLVGIGTGALRDPRVPERIVADLHRWCDAHGVRDLREVVGTLEWPS
jgi:dihydroorotate dehydrogenase (NAD+) catalytic subunit